MSKIKVKYTGKVHGLKICGIGEFPIDKIVEVEESAWIHIRTIEGLKRVNKINNTKSVEMVNKTGFRKMKKKEV